MPRANRHFLKGHVWHLTQRCLDQAFMLKFARDRGRWLRWLYEARRRHGLCVLNYVVTSNHIHLLVLDKGRGEIASSMQLAAGRVAQEYNHRKGRSGGFWEDRYHATAVQSDTHLARCITYIDLNMVRAGVVVHPGDWSHSGYRELVDQRKRYRILDRDALRSMLGHDDDESMRLQRDHDIDTALTDGKLRRDERWSHSLAVGTQDFVTSVQVELGLCAHHRRIESCEDAFTLREQARPSYV